jgi:hypothetical protein
MNIYQIPTHRDLIYFWLETHFPDAPAAVFFDPLGNGNRIDDIAEFVDLNSKEIGKLITADILILPMDLEKLTNFVNNLDEDVYGYVEAWDGKAIITTNS